MKVLVIKFGDTLIKGIEEAFPRDLLEFVDGNMPDDAVDDFRQFAGTWGPDLVVISDAGKGKHDAADVISQLREEKLLRQPGIYVGNVTDEVSVEMLKAGVQALIPASIDSKSGTYEASSDVLSAQAVNLVNLSKGQATRDFRLGAITIMTATKEIYFYNSKLPLTGQEAELFITLGLAKGRTVTKEALFNALYPNDSEVQIKIIDVFICKVRKKLEGMLMPLGYDADGLISTTWGRGYCINLKKVPGLGEDVGREMLLGSPQSNGIDQALLAAPHAHASPNGIGSSRNGLNITPAPAAIAEVLVEMRDHLLKADFKGSANDITAYVTLARRAISEGHAVNELHALFGNCFESVLQRGKGVDLRTFEHHIASPDKLRFYRVSAEIVQAIPAFSGRRTANGADHGANGAGLDSPQAG